VLIQGAPFAEAFSQRDPLLEERDTGSPLIELLVHQGHIGQDAREKHGLPDQFHDEIRATVLRTAAVQDVGDVRMDEGSRVMSAREAYVVRWCRGRPPRPRHVPVLALLSGCGGDVSFAPVGPASSQPPVTTTISRRGYFNPSSSSGTTW
jgi:hypothetical protein